MARLNRMVGLWLVGLVMGPGLASARAAARVDQPLSVGVSGSLEPGNPWTSGFEAEALALEWLRFLPLVCPGEKGELRNIVAKSLVSSDAQTWRVEIRAGVRFASGRELVADDVVATYLLFGSPEGAGLSRFAQFKNLAEVRRLSRYQLEFRLREPQADFPSQLMVGLLPAEARSRIGDNFVGLGFESGPYLGDKVATDELRYSRNAKFSGDVVGLEQPRTKALRFGPRGNRQQLLEGLATGRFDLVQGGVDPEDVVALQKETKSRRYRVVSVGAETTLALALSYQNQVLAHAEVRQALERAVDVGEMIRFLEFDLASVAEGFFLPENPLFQKRPDFDRPNLNEARALLDKAGYRDPDGAGPAPRFALSLKTSPAVREIRTAKAVATQLLPLGIAVEVEVLEPSALAQAVADGRAALWFEQWPVLSRGADLEKVVMARGDYLGTMKKGDSARPNVDQLLVQAGREPRQEKRPALYQDIQRMMWADIPYILLWNSRRIGIVAKDVEGFRPSAAAGYWPLLKAERR
jgi:peptide/nickel transport system substrate-binding protein